MLYIQYCARMFSICVFIYPHFKLACNIRNRFWISLVLEVICLTIITNWELFNLPLHHSKNSICVFDPIYIYNSLWSSDFSLFHLKQKMTASITSRFFSLKSFLSPLQPSPISLPLGHTNLSLLLLFPGWFRLKPPTHILKFGSVAQLHMTSYCSVSGHA